jgi:hypothetical protein
MLSKSSGASRTADMAAFETLCPALASCAEPDEEGTGNVVLQADQLELHPHFAGPLVEFLGQWIELSTEVAAGLRADAESGTANAASFTARAPVTCLGLSRQALVDATLAPFPNGAATSRLVMEHVFDAPPPTHVPPRRAFAARDGEAVLFFWHLHKLAVLAGARLLQAEAGSLMAALLREACAGTEDPRRVVQGWSQAVDPAARGTDGALLRPSESQDAKSAEAWLGETLRGVILAGDNLEKHD